MWPVVYISFSSAVLKEIISCISRFSASLHFGNGIKISLKRGKWLKMRLTFRYKEDVIIEAKNIFLQFPVMVAICTQK